MRFAAVPIPKSEPRLTPAEFVRRLLAGERTSAAHSQQPVSTDPVPDLDQRVRLVGEW